MALRKLSEDTPWCNTREERHEADLINAWRGAFSLGAYHFAAVMTGVAVVVIAPRKE